MSKGDTVTVILTVKLPSRRPGHDDIKEKFEDNIPEDIQIYQEYHALVVKHAKRQKAKNALQLIV